MTFFITPVPVNETDMLVHFCHSSAREGKLESQGYKTSLGYNRGLRPMWNIRISFKEPSK